MCAVSLENLFYYSAYCKTYLFFFIIMGSSISVDYIFLQMKIIENNSLRFYCFRRQILRKEIFTGRNFRDFGSFSRKFMPGKRLN